MNAKRSEYPAGEASDVETLMRGIGVAARAAAAHLADASTEAKNAALHAAAGELRRSRATILAANRADVAGMQAAGATAAMIDRGTLTEARLEAVAEALEGIADLPDPVGAVIAEWDRPNGLHIERVRTPLGVIGVIFESRPNVTADAGALCLKAGNAVDPARRLRYASELRRDPCLPCCGAARRRPAGACDPARADDGPRRGRRHATRPRRRAST